MMTDKSSIAKRLIKDLVRPKLEEGELNGREKNNNNPEPRSDGYVIVSFSNRKKAQIQTATFSDVSKNSSDAIKFSLLKAQNSNIRADETSIPDEDSFYGEAFWIGSEDEEEAEKSESLKAAAQTSIATTESDKSSQKDDNDSLTEAPRPKMSRLTALSKGLLDPEANGVKRPVGKSKSNTNCYGDSRAVYYGGSEDGRKMLRCRECGKHYRNDYSLRHHICLRRKEVWKKGDVPKELVDGQLIYFCPTCSKPFRWMGNLTRHFYVHTGQRFFKCDICDKEFFSAYQVRRHMNSHTGMRYKCRVCEKPFTCVYACTWHMRQHAAETGAPVTSDSIIAIPINTTTNSSNSTTQPVADSTTTPPPVSSKVLISVPSSAVASSNVSSASTKADV